METISVMLSIGALLVAAIGGSWTYFCVIVAMRERLATLETKIDVFWRLVEVELPKRLKTYPTHIEKDILLDKLTHRELTLDEAVHLRTILQSEIEGGNKENLLIAYVLVIGRLEQIIALAAKMPGEGKCLNGL
jgi:hypothetical protein